LDDLGNSIIRRSVSARLRGTRLSLKIARQKLTDRSFFGAIMLLLAVAPSGAFESLNRTDRQIITNAVDKQFTSLDEFDTSGKEAIERLAA
jgi:hypothetical protein